jgi:ribosomal protein S18 acetylase RimI-like enzyme
MADALETPQPIPRLIADELTAISPPLASFSCGTEPWHEELNSWITTTEFQEVIKKYGTRVWIYRNKDEIVGYGALGTTKRPPPPPGPDREFAIIPCLAIQTDYQGKPPGCSRDDKYSGQIMKDLILKARQLGPAVLILYCHPQNAQAAAFYDNFGFDNHGLIERNHHILRSVRLS